jgi:hypothetical protein
MLFGLVILLTVVLFLHIVFYLVVSSLLERLSHVQDGVVAL